MPFIYYVHLTPSFLNRQVAKVGYTGDVDKRMMELKRDYECDDIIVRHTKEVIDISDESGIHAELKNKGLLIDCDGRRELYEINDEVIIDVIDTWIIGSNAINKYIDDYEDNEFVTVDFLGVKVMKRKSDGYLNASHLCKSEGRCYSNWIATFSAKQLLREFSKTLNIPNNQLVYTLSKGFPNHTKGTYVYPSIMIHIAMWINPMYSVKVSDVMSKHIECLANIN